MRTDPKNIARFSLALAVPTTVAALAGLIVIGGPPAGLAVGAVIIASAVCAQATLAYVALRIPEHEALFWAYTSLATLCLFAREYFDLLGRLGTLAGPVSTAVSLTAFAAAAVFGGMALWQMSRPEIVSGAALAGYATDLAALVLVLLMATLSLLVPPSIANSNAEFDQLMPMALYPSFTVGIICFGAVFKRTPWRPHEFALGAWLAGLGLRDLVFLASTGATHALPPGATPALTTDALLAGSYVVAAAAGMIRLREAPVMALVKGEERRTEAPVWPSFAAPLLAMLLTPVISIHAAVENWEGHQVWVNVAVIMVVGVLFTLRAYLLNTENSVLRRISTTDPLTGLLNHRQFHERLDLELARGLRDGIPVSVAMIDIDDFDQVNNIYGHAAGDRRLRAIADSLTGPTRSSDVVCRVGGDEFAVVMPNASPIDAYAVCLRAQTALHGIDDGYPLPAGISIGIAAAPDHASAREELVERADGALYWAKFHGRENVVVYDPELVRALGPSQRLDLLEEEAYVNMVQLLASAVDARDPFTQQHSRNVAALAIALCREIELDPERHVPIETAALLHDVGKIGVPDAILRKPEQLTAEEFEVLDEHPALATNILKAIPRREILPWITAHHEHWDGSGYPEGLAGEDIPLESRIIALCDSFDVMTSEGPHRPALDAEAACREILASAGSQFDPTLARRFVDMIRNRDV